MLKRFFSTYIILATLVIGIYGSTAQKAHAIGPVFDANQLISTIKDIGIDTLVTIVNTRILDKLVNDTLNWANGGFDGEPGFINNWDGFLEGAANDILSVTLSNAASFANVAVSNYERTGNLNGEGGGASGFQIALDTTEQESYDKCVVDFIKAEYNKANDFTPESKTAYNNCARNAQGQQNIVIPGLGSTQAIQCLSLLKTADANTDLQLDSINLNGIFLNQCLPQKFQFGGQAAINFDMFGSADIRKPRELASTISRFALDKVTKSSDIIDSLMAGEGETLSKLLGSQGAVDKFLGGDMQSGGWNAFIALGDPHNSATGREILIKNLVAKKIADEENKELLDLMIPDKTENKEKCKEYKKDAEGKPTKECAPNKTIIETAGSLVSAKVKQGLNKEEERSKLAKELSDILAQAVGKLATGLLQAGMKSLGGSVADKGGSALADITNSDILDNVYQSSYDILGIGDTPETNLLEEIEEAEEEEESVASIINSEELKNDASIPNIEELELIINLETDLESRYNTSNEYLELGRTIMKEKEDVVQEIADLDHCNPGPDHGWLEQANVNIANMGGSDDQTRKDLNNAALGKMKGLVKDPLINIPGALELTQLVDSYLEESGTSTAYLLKAKKKAFFSLIQLRSFVKLDFTKFKQKRKEAAEAADRDAWSNFPIFEGDWDRLSVEQRIAILSIKNNPGNTTSPQGAQAGAQQNLANAGNSPIRANANLLVQDNYLLEVGADNVAMVLNEKNGKTPSEFYHKDPEKAKEIVLGYAWSGVWKKGMLAKPAGISATTGKPTLSGKEQRDNIIRFLFSIRMNLATTQDVVNFKIELDNLRGNNQRLRDYLHDCKQFRNYVFGYNWSKEKLANTREILPPTTYAYSSPNNQDSDEIAFRGLIVKIGALPKVDHEKVKSYLKEQRNIQLDDNPHTESDFITDLYTAEGYLENSILGKTEQEVQDYYWTIYGPKPSQTRSSYRFVYLDDPAAAATNLARIFNRSYVIPTKDVPGGGNLYSIPSRRSVLFCWSTADYLHENDIRDLTTHVPDCFGWGGYTPDIKYKVLLSEINS